MSSDRETGTTLRLLYASEGGVRSIFSERATDYAVSRPDYPAALFEVLKMNCAPNKGAVVADIGSGTGQLTQGLLKSGYRVVAVEPNAEMRDVSDFRLGEIAGYSSISGCAESIPLESASVDLIPGRNTPAGPVIADRVSEIFSHFADNETVKVQYRTVAIIGRPT